MDFDKLSLKEQLEFKIYGTENLIEEQKILIKYFEDCVELVKKDIYRDENVKPKNYPSPWRMSRASYEDTLTMMNKRLSHYKESLYKLKDELYNLKENENLVSSE